MKNYNNYASKLSVTMKHIQILVFLCLVMLARGTPTCSTAHVSQIGKKNDDIEICTAINIVECKVPLGKVMLMENGDWLARACHLNDNDDCEPTHVFKIEQRDVFAFYTLHVWGENEQNYTCQSRVSKAKVYVKNHLHKTQQTDLLKVGQTRIDITYDHFLKDVKLSELFLLEKVNLYLFLFSMEPRIEFESLREEILKEMESWEMDTWEDAKKRTLYWNNFWSNIVEFIGNLVCHLFLYFECFRIVTLMFFQLIVNDKFLPNFNALIDYAKRVCLNFDDKYNEISSQNATSKRKERLRKILS